MVLYTEPVQADAYGMENAYTGWQSYYILNSIFVLGQVGRLESEVERRCCYARV